MPKKLKPADIVAYSRQIVQDYRAMGLRLTVRQLYYQFVARDLLPSGQRSYKKIVRALTDSRLKAQFPMDAIEDRGRHVGNGDFCTDFVDPDVGEQNVMRRIATAPEWAISRSRWWGQPEHVSVWVEKEALSGVFIDPCKELGVGLFACKGYPSVSALWSYLVELSVVFRLGFAQKATILYFGDHDPDGWEIPRSAARNLHLLMENHGLGHMPIEFVRVALNMDQIKKYDPPPFGAKVTSSRYQGYVDEHLTDDAWELDALDPAVLQELIREGVDARFDDKIHEKNQRTVREVRAEVRSRMLAEGFIADAFEQYERR